MNDWAVLALIYLTLFLGSPLIVLLHELGHALAYLWLTKPESVDIHVGTYGSKTNTFSFKLGKINIYVSRSWRIIKSAGICVSSKLETDYRKHIVILLAGVFFTLFVACLPSLIVFCTHANLLLRIVCYMFLFLSAVSLLHNLIPFNIRGGNYGAALESDGKQIIFALKAKKHYAEYISAMQCVKTKDYKAAIEKLEIVNNAIPGSPKAVRYLNILNIQARQYDAAHHYFVELEKLTELQITDLIIKDAYIHTRASTMKQLPCIRKP